MECQFCHGGSERRKICGKLHSVVNENCHCVAHHRCMQYSSNLEQFKFPQFGGFYIEHVEKEVKRGKKLTCSICKRKGATAGCAVKDCKRTYHYPCASKADGVRVCRLVKYASQDVQDVDTNSTVVSYCIFCSPSHHSIYTENLRLASGDELSSNSEDDVEDGSAEELSKCTTNVDLFQQLYPSSPSPDDNVNLQSRPINQIDSSTFVVENVPLPTTMDGKKNSGGTSSTVKNNVVGNISISDAAVSATPSWANHVDQNLVDSASRSDCRRDRLCLKSSQRKRKARQMDHSENEDSAQFKPLLQEKELLDERLKSSNKRARIDSSPQTLSETETKGISTSSAETIRVNNGRVGESGFSNGFLINLNIPDPLDDQIRLKQPKNLRNICASSSRKKSAKMPNPDHSQPVITSFLTPAKKLDMTVTRICATEVPKVAKDKPKAQKRLQLSDTNTKSNENVIETRLTNEAEVIQGDFNSLPSSVLPVAEMNVSPTENVDASQIAEVIASPTTEIVSAAEAFVSSVSVSFSGSLERIGNQSKTSTSMSGISELARSRKTLSKQNLPSTIRKLVLDGKGSFSLMSEIKSLLEPQSDSSSDARDGTESDDIDSSDLDWNSTSTVSSPGYEELSSTFFLHQLEENTDIDQVCGLCIPVIEESLDDRMSKALLKYAICSLDLVEENIFLWQITGLNEVQILSMILQFSQYLRDKNELELQKKLFKQKICDADILLDNEISFTKENVEAIQQEIEQNFSEAEKKYGRCVGKLCSFDDLRISAAFVILSNTNDNTGAARSSLPKNHRVHVCDEDTKFVISHNLCDAQRTIVSANEYENLKWWLETFDYSTVLFYPTENVLQSSNTPSVTNRLKNYFMQRTVPGGDTSFVFIQRTNPDLLVYRSFVCKLLAFVKEELLTCNHDACIVFDVGKNLRIAKLADVVMQCLIGDQGTSYCFEVEAFSGTNPVFSPVSCLVIHLLLKFPDNS